MYQYNMRSIRDKKLVFCQAETMDEAKKAGLPPGIFCWWEYDGQRMDAQGILNLVKSAAIDGHLNPLEMLDSEGVQGHYRRMIAAQKSAANTVMDRLGRQYEGTPLAEHWKSVRASMEPAASMPYPDADGIFRPDAKTAEAMLAQIQAQNLITQAEKTALQAVLHGD